MCAITAPNKKPTLWSAPYITVYTDKYGGQGWNRTTDTGIFSPLLYRLSYLAVMRRAGY
jgi:hypothetical protein